MFLGVEAYNKLFCFHHLFNLRWNVLQKLLGLTNNNRARGFFMSQIYFAVHENTYKLKSVNLYRNKIWKRKAYYPFTSNIFRAELSRRRVCAHRHYWGPR